MKPAIMARAAAKSSAFLTSASFERSGRSTGPFRGERSVVKVAFLNSPVMIAFQVVREIPNRGIIAHAAFQSASDGRACPDHHEDVRIESPISALGGREAS